jgi:hypothetical protein
MGKPVQQVIGQISDIETLFRMLGSSSQPIQTVLSRKKRRLFHSKEKQKPNWMIRNRANKRAI